VTAKAVTAVDLPEGKRKIMCWTRRIVFRAACLIAAAACCLLVSGAAFGQHSITIINNGEISGPFFADFVEESPDLIVGGFTQTESQVALLDGVGGRNFSNLTAAFRMVANGENAFATKTIIGSGYAFPLSAQVASHQMVVRARIYGPVGATLEIGMSGELDGLPTTGVLVKLVKDLDEPFERIRFALRSPLTLFDSLLAAPHTRTVHFTFQTGNGALEGTDVRMNSSQSPFGVPEPGSLALFGIGALGLLGRIWRRRMI